MGWTSTADPLENVGRAGMVFASADAAAAFCEAQGWGYSVRHPNPATPARSKRYATYGDNFSVKRKGLPVGGLVSEAAPTPAAARGRKAK